MFDGRVKTLHQKFTLEYYDRQNKFHIHEMNKQRFPSLDLIVVNFYPFKKWLDAPKIQKYTENIDIGGPTMVRAAAKNFKNVAIITNKNDYQ